MGFLTFFLEPLKGLLAWLFKHPFELLTLALCIACFALYWYNSSLKAELVAARATATRQQQNVKDLKIAIAAQSAGVERILQNGVANVAAAKAQALAEQKASNQVRIVYQTRIERIQGAPVPADCASAADWAAHKVADLLGADQ